MKRKMCGEEQTLRWSGLLRVRHRDVRAMSRIKALGFIFITGVEDSGTTMLPKLLS